MKSFWKCLRSYALSILLALAVGALAGWLTRDSMQEFALLRQPPLSPPGWVFGVVWTILYILMGTSAAMVWQSDRLRRNEALWAYGLQLLVNFWWPIFFFRLEARLFSFFWLLLLIVLVLIMMVRFSRIKRAAAWLNLPYLLWLLFAAYLNLGVYLLNR